MIISSCHHITTPSHHDSRKVEVIFGPKSKSKAQNWSFTPSPRIVDKKINELQAMIFDKESASDALKKSQLLQNAGFLK